MKKLVYLFLMLCLMAGCTHTSRHPQLVAVDSLLSSQPDSALKLLRHLLPSFGGIEGGSSTADRMYYYLLLADACNKCYDTLPSDSVMHLVADFYDAHGTPNEQVRAHYLLGCVYRDLGEAPQALDCYHTALDRADTTASDCNYRLLMSVYGQMADLFHRQNLPQDEIWALEKSGQCDLIRGDTIGYIGSQELMMRAYGIMRDTTKTIETILETQRLYKEHNNIQLSVRTNASLAYILLNRNDIDEAKTLLDDYEIYSGLFEKEGNIVKGYEAYYNIKALFYHKKNQLDSAEYWYRKELRDGKDFNNQNGGALGLAMVFEQRHIPDSAAKYYQYAYAMNDSMYAQMTTETISRTQALYNYSRHQQIADTEARNAERARHNSIVILLCSIFLLTTLSYIYIRLRKKKNQKIIQLSQDYRQSILDYNKVSAELEKIKQKDTTLQHDKQNEVESLKEKVKTFQKKLQATNSCQQLTDFKENKIVSLFKSKSTGNRNIPLPTDAEWNRLVRQFSRFVPSAYTALGRDIILSQTELRLCILLLLGFKIGDAAILLDTTAQSITNIKTKANKKLFNESTAATLEKNLTSIFGKV